MTKTLASILLVALLSLTAWAQNASVVLQDGSANNKSWVTIAGTNVSVANSVAAAGSFDVTSTNIGTLLRANKVLVPAQNVGVRIGGSAQFAAGTNAITYTFEKSLTGSDWVAWTNLAVVPNGVTVVSTNVVFSLGDWQYIRLQQITNNNSVVWRSNYLGFFWKQ